MDDCAHDPCYCKGILDHLPSLTFFVFSMHLAACVMKTVSAVLLWTISTMLSPFIRS